MPTFVARRVGRFPVRVSLNITEDHSLALDRVERDTGESRGVLAREAFAKGLPLVIDCYRKRLAAATSRRKAAPVVAFESSA